MNKEGLCCFCGKEYIDYGNDIRPLVSIKGDRCCVECNQTVVIPNRLKFWNSLYGYAIKDNCSGKLINQYGLPTDVLNNHDDKSVMIFNNEEMAKAHLVIDHLFHHEVVRVMLKEDN